MRVVSESRRRVSWEIRASRFSRSSWILDSVCRSCSVGFGGIFGTELNWEYVWNRVSVYYRSVYALGSTWRAKLACVSNDLACCRNWAQPIPVELAILFEIEIAQSTVQDSPRIGDCSMARW